MSLFAGSVPELRAHTGAAGARSPDGVRHELVPADVPSLPDQRQQLHAGDGEVRAGRLSVRSAAQFDGGFCR